MTSLEVSPEPSTNVRLRVRIVTEQSNELIAKTQLGWRRLDRLWPRYAPAQRLQSRISP
jgi:hypothetical protein